MLRSAYVGAMRVLRRAASGTGVLERLDRAGHPLARHVLTLFAIHDAEELARLDLPWWTYGGISEVETFLASRPDARAFEYGSGASTVFLARRVASLHSVEHDVGFAAVVRGMIAGMEHAHLHEVAPAPVTPGTPAVRSERGGYRNLDFTAYVETIGQVGGTFDLIVIDGRARVACLRRAVEHLSDDGLIVFDDVGRRRYQPALTTPGMHVTMHRGLRPSLFYPSSTALLRPDGTAA